MGERLLLLFHVGISSSKVAGKSVVASVRNAKAMGFFEPLDATKAKH